MTEDLVLELGHTVTVDKDLFGFELLSIYIANCGVDGDEEEIFIDKENAEKLIEHLMAVFNI